MVDITPAWARGTLAPEELEWLARLIRTSCGIKLGPGKRSMLEGRLRRRLRALGLADFQAYLELLADPALQVRELPELIEAVTTNHTSFWREPKQFTYLAEEGLARLAGLGAGTQAPLRAWSAACSTGEEPYTLAMVLAEAAREGPIPRGFAVLGTDIAPAALAHARRAVYREQDVAPLPPALRLRHLMRARDRSLGLVRVAPELRRAVELAPINLIERAWPVQGPFDLILCRNVLIYFELEDQRRVLSKLCERLRPGGILCLGHADNTMAVKLPIRAVRANIYERL
jgi:chemotaxis protein methyltransferase CheR